MLCVGPFFKQGGWQFNEDYYYYYCCCNLLNPTVSFQPFSPSGSRQGGSSMREVVWHVCLDIEETHLERCTMSDNKGLAQWVISKWTRSGTGRQSDQRSGEDESFPLDIEQLESHESSRAEQYQLPNLPGGAEEDELPRQRTNSTRRPRVFDYMPHLPRTFARLARGGGGTSHATEDEESRPPRIRLRKKKKVGM